MHRWVIASTIARTCCFNQTISFSYETQGVLGKFLLHSDILTLVTRKYNVSYVKEILLLRKDYVIYLP